MLSSITPLGQRARGMSWGRTVVGFWVGATFAGAAVYTIAGLAGHAIGLTSLTPWLMVAVLALAAALDLARVRPPGPRRQVDEDWLGRYRDWVIGVGFGGQLGIGFATIVPSWGYWATLLVAVLGGLPLAVWMGVGFGVGRSLLLLSTRKIGSPGSLAETMRRFASAESVARWTAMAGYVLVIVTVGFHVA
jgi:hypothetical protein